MPSREAEIQYAAEQILHWAKKLAGMTHGKPKPFAQRDLAKKKTYYFEDDGLSTPSLELDDLLGSGEEISSPPVERTD